MRLFLILWYKSFSTKRCDKKPRPKDSTKPIDNRADLIVQNNKKQPQANIANRMNPSPRFSLLYIYKDVIFIYTNTRAEKTGMRLWFLHRSLLKKNMILNEHRAQSLKNKFISFRYFIFSGNRN